MYKENGFKEKTTAQALIRALEENGNPLEMTIKSITMKDEKKQAPLLYNLAELQNDCSKMFKISPDETLNVVQQLYEKQAGNLSKNRCQSSYQRQLQRRYSKNISGLQYYQPIEAFLLQNILKATVLQEPCKD